MKLRVGLVLLVGTLIAADAKDDATKKDLEKIQGTWTVVGFEIGGEKVPEKAAKGLGTFKFTGDKLLMKAEGKETLRTFRLDATKKPKAITWTGKAKVAELGSEKGKIVKKESEKDETIRAIYELGGNKLRICIGRLFGSDDKESDRPKEFKTTKGKEAVIYTLAREKK